VLTRRTWFMRGLPHANCGDKFRVTQRGNRLTVKRVDRGGRNCHGWGMRLQFKCKKLRRAVSPGRSRRGGRRGGRRGRRSKMPCAKKWANKKWGPWCSWAPWSAWK
jgi:hypothetical protein